MPEDRPGMEPVVKGRRPGSMAEVWALSYPIAVSMASNALMGVVDTFFLGWTEQSPVTLIASFGSPLSCLGDHVSILPVAGTSQQGGVALAAVITWTLCSLFTGTLTAVASFVAQNKGAGRLADCGRYAWLGIYLSIPFGLLMAFLGPFSGSLLRLVGAVETARPAAAAYLEVRLLGSGSIFFYFALVNFFRGMGDTRTPMWVTLIDNSVNVVLNYVLIFGKLGAPAMGAAGAGLATVLATCSGGAVYFLLFLTGDLSRTYDTRRTWRISFSMLKRFAFVGFPVGGTWILENGSWALFTVFVSRMGEKELAAHAIVLQLMHLSFLPGVAFLIGTTTLVGQYLGMGSKELADKAARSSLRMTWMVMGSMAVLFAILKGRIVGVFNSDPEVVFIGGRLLLITAGFQLLDGTYMICSGALRGAGDTRWPFWVVAVSSWLFFVPMVHVLGNVAGFGVFGAWFAVLLHLMLLAALMYGRFARGRWKELSPLVEEATELPRDEASMLG